MRPLRQENLSHPSFPRWDKACVLVQNTEAAHTWAKANAESIQKKREVYLAKWNAKPDKPVLNPEDGR
jgi:hypothetical protein